jgi:hypothetical protein
LSDEKISDMPDAGALVSTDMLPLVRLGSPNLNLSTTQARLAANSITYVKLGTTNPYVLADGTFAGQRVGIKDNLRLASGEAPIIIAGKIDGGTSIAFVIAGMAMEFVWDIPSNTWLVF